MSIHKSISVMAMKFDQKRKSETKIINFEACYVTWNLFMLSGWFNSISTKLILITSKQTSVWSVHLQTIEDSILSKHRQKITCLLLFFIDKDKSNGMLENEYFRFLLQVNKLDKRIYSYLSFTVCKKEKATLWSFFCFFFQKVY